MACHRIAKYLALDSTKYKFGMAEAVQSETTIREVEAEIDAMLRRREPVLLRTLRRLAVTESNVRRLFGMSMEQLFIVLAQKLGYELVLEEDSTGNS